MEQSPTEEKPKSVFKPQANLKFLYDLVDDILQKKLLLYGVPPEYTNQWLKEYLDEIFSKPWLKKLIGNVLVKGIERDSFTKSNLRPAIEGYISEACTEDDITDYFAEQISSAVSSRSVVLLRETCLKLRTDGEKLLKPHQNDQLQVIYTTEVLPKWRQLDQKIAYSLSNIEKFSRSVAHFRGQDFMMMTLFAAALCLSMRAMRTIAFSTIAEELSTLPDSEAFILDWQSGSASRTKNMVIAESVLITLIIMGSLVTLGSKGYSRYLPGSCKLAPFIDSASVQYTERHQLEAKQPTADNHSAGTSLMHEIFASVPRTVPIRVKKIKKESPVPTRDGKLLSAPKKPESIGIITGRDDSKYVLITNPHHTATSRFFKCRSSQDPLTSREERSAFRKVIQHPVIHSADSQGRQGLKHLGVAERKKLFPEPRVVAKMKIGNFRYPVIERAPTEQEIEILPGCTGVLEMGLTGRKK